LRRCSTIAVAGDDDVFFPRRGRRRRGAKSALARQEEGDKTEKVSSLTSKLVGGMCFPFVFPDSVRVCVFVRLPFSISWKLLLKIFLFHF